MSPNTMSDAPTQFADADHRRARERRRTSAAAGDRTRRRVRRARWRSAPWRFELIAERDRRRLAEPERAPTCPRRSRVHVHAERHDEHARAGRRRAPRRRASRPRSARQEAPSRRPRCESCERRRRVMRPWPDPLLAGHAEQLERDHGTSAPSTARHRSTRPVPARRDGERLADGGRIERAERRRAAARGRRRTANRLTSTVASAPRTRVDACGCRQRRRARRRPRRERRSRAHGRGSHAIDPPSHRGQRRRRVHSAASWPARPSTRS